MPSEMAKLIEVKSEEINKLVDILYSYFPFSLSFKDHSYQSQKPDNSVGQHQNWGKLISDEHF